jgi:putative acetyltransferase
LPYGDHTEQFIVEALRDANALTISLVAVDGEGGGPRGFLARDRLRWYLRLVWPRPYFCLAGITEAGNWKIPASGRPVIAEVIGRKGLRSRGGPGYYERFGFRSIPDLAIDGVPQEIVLALPFVENKAHGVVTFHEGFAASE